MYIDENGLQRGSKGGPFCMVSPDRLVLTAGVSHSGCGFFGFGGFATDNAAWVRWRERTGMGEESRLGAVFVAPQVRYDWTL